MEEELKIQIIQGALITDIQYQDIIALCNRAYREHLDPLFRVLPAEAHVLGFLSGELASHAMWVTRWLQPGEAKPLRTAYVEMVATDPQHQRKGFAAAVMRRLVEAIPDYELAALCPAEPDLNARVGWRFWRGPLFIRTGRGLIETPDERVMIFDLLPPPFHSALVQSPPQA